MKATEFGRWVEQAREMGATHLEVRRARQNGGSSSVFFRDELSRVDVVRLLERMREDLTGRHRRLSRASFDVLALKDEREEMRDVVVIARDEDDEPAAAEVTTVEGASVAMQAAAFAAAREAHRDLRDATMGCMQTLQHVTEQLSAKLVESQTKQAEVMALAFEVSSMRFEREEAERASSERRHLASKALEELAPVAGAALSYITKNATPAWGAFAQRIQNNGKLPKLLELLDSEEVALMSEAIGFTFPTKGGSHVEGAR